MIKSSSATIQKVNEPSSFEKPTILDIISETERNQTKAQGARFQPPAQPIVADTSKSIGHVDLASGHAGIAEPLTWQQLEHEMSVVDQKVKDSSTSKDGISTWILLSGSDQAQSSPTPPAATTIIGTVDRIDVKKPVTDRENYRFEELQQAKLNKLTKLREAIDRRRGRPEKKIPKPVEVTPSPDGILQSTDVVTETKIVQRRKNPTQKANKRKTTTTTSTTTTEKPEEETTLVQYIQENLDFVTTTTTTPTPFIVLEPKDADFILPQDRSPGTTKKPKRPSSTKIKRKNTKVNKQKKTPIKTQVVKPTDKPMVSKIYSYLAREVMPTVGVGLMGLVVTAGLASYLFGPLGALRRSYDDALDRQDNADNIYAVNSEEYASGSSDSGQNEEELFGKFIAGMPANYMPKYVKYFGPQHQQQRPGDIQYNPYPQRRAHGQPAMGGPAGPGGPGPKYNPHFVRNRPDMAVYPKVVSNNNQYSTIQYHQPAPQTVQLRNHQPQPQQPLATSYNPHYHDIQQQKSLGNNMETILKLNKAEAYVAEPNTNYNTIVQEKSVGTSIMAEAPAETKEAEIKLSEEEIENDENKMQRRTSQFVVGSVLPDIKSNEAIVSASMKTADILPSNGQSASHGPRRRRRRAITQKQMQLPKRSLSLTQEKSVRQLDKPDEKPSSAISTYTTRVYNQTEIQHLDELYNRIKLKLDNFTKNQSNDEQTKQKNAEKIQKEFQNLEKDMSLLKQVVADVKDIETFQKEFHIRAKNFELAMTIKTGTIHIRQRMRLIADLIDHPDDERIIQKINRRDGSTTDVAGMETSTRDPAAQFSIDKVNSLNGLLKLLQLKAAFGIHVLQNIRPSFEKAFEEVFKMPVQGNLNL